MEVAIDIETENLGSDVMNDNKRLLSIQIGTSKGQELYWADSKQEGESLSFVPKRIDSLIVKGCIFVGYNIKGFDLVFLNKFLDVEIPEKNIFELIETNGVNKIKAKKGKRYCSLEEACSEYGVDVKHKKLMDKRAELFINNREIMDQAKVAAKKLVKEKGWSTEFSYDYALKKIAGGNAIFDAYNEFIQMNGSKKTLFYEYAIGDIISEYNLFQALRGG
jgi:hypothetical protein